MTALTGRHRACICRDCSHAGQSMADCKVLGLLCGCIRPKRFQGVRIPLPQARARGLRKSLGLGQALARQNVHGDIASLGGERRYRGAGEVAAKGRDKYGKDG